ncbi:MAG: hypothetical protein KKH04_05085 [Proteobacteria bacterium]|nr:hypothetical protein [Pseudomonadota bacterium]
MKIGIVGGGFVGSTTAYAMVMRGIGGEILHDHRAILTVCTPMNDVADVSKVTVSLPHLVGGQGILATFPLPLNEGEQSALQKSARTIREVIDELERPSKGRK